MLTNINQQIADTSHGRLFAVIHIAGRQFKVTSEDILLILANKSFPDVGEKIILSKVSNFLCLLKPGATYGIIKNVELSYQ